MYRHVVRLVITKKTYQKKLDPKLSKKLLSGSGRRVRLEWMVYTIRYLITGVYFPDFTPENIYVCTTDIMCCQYGTIILFDLDVVGLEFLFP